MLDSLSAEYEAETGRFQGHEQKAEQNSRDGQDVTVQGPKFLARSKHDAPVHFASPAFPARRASYRYEACYRGWPG